MDAIKKAYLQLHIAVVLFGFTAILGRLIDLNEISIVWWRLIITCLSLLFFPSVVRTIRQTRLKDWLPLAGIGILVATHWVFFYGAIKYSNVSVTLCCLATGSFFTAILEPIFYKKQIRMLEVVTGLVVIPGIYIIFYTTDFAYTKGIIMALISAILAAFFAVLNKKMVVKQEPMFITFVELGAGLLFLSILLPVYWEFLGDGVNKFMPTTTDLFYLVVLALLCTTLAYVLSLLALKHLSAFTSTLTINLEPVYGIILAIIIFQENQELNPGFYLGAAIILSTVFGYPYVKKYLGK
ncbi:MAG: EamA family transporter [Bacteroidota bacterium]